jgi:glycosyltransferase involved in cell wall biosynthesis
MQIKVKAAVNQVSYGIAGLNIVKALVKQGNDVSYWPIGPIQCYNKEDADIIQGCYNKQVFFPHSAPSLKCWHEFDLSEGPVGGLRVNYSFFELDDFTDRQKHHIESSDIFLVASNWAKQITLQNTNLTEKRVYVCPLGIDQQTFYPRDLDEKFNFRDNPDNFVFLTIGKAERRKNHHLLVEIFNKAFTQEDKVELWLMIDNPFLNEEEMKEWMNLYLSSTLGNKIKFIPRVQQTNAVAEVIRASDCYLGISSAEGFDLPLLEALSCGKSAIVSNYSAHTEFCNSENSKLVEIDGLEPAYDEKFFRNAKGSWAKFGESQIDQSVQHMRDAYKKGKLINRAGIQTGMKFTWDNTAATITNILSNHG